MPVNTSHDEYDQNVAKWTRCRDVAEGSDAVKAKGELYLPRLAGQDASDDGRRAYKAYLLAALFYNATNRTVDGLAGAVLRKPIGKDGIPGTIEDQLKDVTLTDVSLDAMTRTVLREVINPGRFGVLLDMPRQESATARPYWVPYAAEQIINWRETVQAGDTILTLLVLREDYQVIDPGDEFKAETRCRYRVLSLELTEDGRTNGLLVRIFIPKTDDNGRVLKDEYVEDAEQRATPTRRGKRLEFIPFVFFGPNGIDPCVDKPPLEDLVLVNLSHYRNSADREHILHHLAPTPWVTGGANDGGAPLPIGPSRWLTLSDPNAKVGLMEPTGQGVKPLTEAMQDKQAQMATLGGRLLESQKATGPEAADTVRMRQTGEQAALAGIAAAVSLGLSKLIQWHAFWFGVDEGTADKATIALAEDYTATGLSGDVIKALLLALQDSRISFDTWYAALERAELTVPGVDVEAELAKIEADITTREGMLPEPPPEPTPGPEPQPGDQGQGGAAGA